MASLSDGLERLRRIIGMRAEDEVESELEFHLEMRVHDLVAGGMDLRAARAKAVRDFGDRQEIARECRTIATRRNRKMRMGQRLEELRQDAAYAARQLLRSPGFATVAVLTLALGIGANTAIFSVVNGVLLQPLPYPDADRLVRLAHVWEGNRSVVSPANFRDMRAESRSLEELSFFSTSSATLTGRGDPVRLQSAEVGANFFQVLGTRPLLGRVFRPDENQPGRTGVAVLSHGIWRERFGADPQVVGRTITLDGEPVEVVGVMPEGFSYPSERDLWTPFEYDSWFMSPESRGAWFINPVGRLKPGATVEELNRELQTLTQRLEQEFPESFANLGFGALSLRELMVGDVRTALLVLLGAVGFVLLIACANVANLLLARATSREGEFAVRAALGAGRDRLVRQLLVESGMLGLLGGALGLLLAAGGTRLLVALQPEGIPRLQEVGVDATVVGFALAASLLTALLFGLVPALQVTRSGMVSALREGGRGALSGRASARVRRGLVVAEMALAVMLLVGAGLLVKSFLRLQQVDPGFQPQGALSLGVSLPEVAYGTDAERAGFFRQLLPRLEALPGVTSAGAVMALPMSGGSFTIAFEVAGREPARPGEEPSAEVRPATPDYFRTVGIPLLRGRSFTEQDRGGSAPVVLLSAETARRHFAGQDPIGQQITLGWTRDSIVDGEVVGEKEVGGEVVGIVGDVRQFGLERDAEPTIYLPYAQVPQPSMDLVLRTSVPPMSLAAAVKREVEALDPNLPLQDVQPLEALVSESVSQPRFYMVLLSVFAGVALVLASIGIFGVISYSVTQRTREIGLRIALGADPWRVLRLVVGGAFTLAALGVALGLLGALAGTRLLSGLLFGVEATDPVVLATVSAVLLGVTLLASYLPARRATGVGPMSTLRES